ncbi:MAG: hypothetical protein KDI22_08150 [Gammaproteobacteria bacterium]|nr:hypothetical protein [Gammaproteobacteria bacterium]MCP5317935.1 hypothetical protein [Chromatiaceae bacterium]MCP5429050.1 hypothetical protein [Chromatiaceae bacterium]MCP5436242.1 hypothetical protein [Chromatiaceae bacterium]HPQ23782.1 hypothetical protein [Gammaproteobacteria bacterium]
MNWPRILLTPLGLLLMAWGTVTPVLGLFGTETTGRVTDTRRLNYERNEPLRNRFNYSINYRFSTRDGRVVDGTTNMLGSFSKVPALRQDHALQIRYFPIWPVINSPSIQARPNIEHLVVLIGGWFLAFGLWRRKKSGRRSSAGRGSRSLPPR